MEAIVFTILTVFYTPLIFASLALGFFLGMLWEVFRILRRAFKHNGFAVAMEDLLFFFVSAIGSWIVCFSFSMGTIRWFFVFSLLVGLLLYLSTLGRIATRLSEKWIRAFFRFVCFVRQRILLPSLEKSFRLLCWMLDPFCRCFRRFALRWRKRKLEKKLRRLLYLSSRGFPTK